MPLLDTHLIFVTGKGGAGKTVVSAALALAGLHRRRRVLLVEHAPFGRLADLFGLPPFDPEPRLLRDNLWGVAVHIPSALASFVHDVLRLRALSQRLLASTSFQVLTAAAPWLAHFLTLRQVHHWTQARELLPYRRARFDLVIVDAPATGHAQALLTIPRTLEAAVPVGPVADAARELGSLLGDPLRTRVVVVTRPEELAVNETIETYTALSEGARLAVARPILNGVLARRFSPAEERWLLSLPRPAVERYPEIRGARFRIARAGYARRQAGRLRRALRRPPVALPLLPTRKITASALGPLATILGRATVD